MALPAIVMSGEFNRMSEIAPVQRLCVLQTFDLGVDQREEQLQILWPGQPMLAVRNLDQACPTAGYERRQFADMVSGNIAVL